MNYLRMHSKERKEKALAEDKKNSQCAGKTEYNSYHEADRALKLCKRRAPVLIYRCEFCHKWHIGNSTQKLARKTRKANGDH